jgi:uncharacterized membrane protein YqjE
MLQDEFKKVEEMASHFKAYVDTRVSHAKLVVAEKISKLLSVLIAGMFVLFVFLFFIVFGGIAAAIAIGYWLSNMAFGFLIVAVFFLLLGVITWAAREKILRIPIMNAIIRQLFSKEANDEEDQK